ncbi:hypothetical protein [Agromyces salentinus]|uniref:Lipoprotein n=1 Tax=Agromyces salentinus TaxID=269421 RepID=A0ABP4YNI6_9MICO|nr:hypothetical protein [Agromyces salentinus]
MPSLRITAIAPAVLAILLLSGCAAGGAPVADSGAPEPTATQGGADETAPEGSGEQSTEEACAILQSGAQEFVDISSREQDAAAWAAEDPAGAVAEVRAAADAFAAGAAQVTNADVAAVAAPAEEAMTAYAEFLEDVLANPLEADAQGMAAQAQTLGETFTAIGGVCD